MRATMLGNTMAGDLKKLTGMEYLRILWEAGCFDFKLLSYCSSGLQVKITPAPAVVTPLKPKMWLVGSVEIPAKMAVQLK